MSDNKDLLGNRIKNFYENSYRIFLPKKLPVIVRVDGKGFHQYLKGCEKPFDQNVIQCMNETALYICKNVQGCKFAYVQSDEISLLITDYDSIKTESYFNNNLQKMVSVIASTASSYFTSVSHKIFNNIKLAQFDARAFVLPKEEVNNYFIWRQNDNKRNSLQMLARSLYSNKDCLNKKTLKLKEMCFAKGISWESLPNYQRMGRCVIKNKEIKNFTNPITGTSEESLRSDWCVDNNIPSFVTDTNYVNKYVFLENK